MGLATPGRTAADNNKQGGGQNNSKKTPAGAQQTMGLACHDAPGAPQRTIYKAQWADAPGLTRLG